MSGAMNSHFGTAKPVGGSITITATNASISSDTTFYYAAYTTPGTFTNDFVVSGGTLTADILVVGSGGQGGYPNLFAFGTDPFGGGGGGGQVQLFSNVSIVFSYTVIVGQGGGVGNATTTALPGNPSRFGNFTQSVGGAKGGDATAAGNGGLAGGGGGSSVITTSGTGTFAGGNGRGSGTQTGRSGGGGGGATSAGSNGGNNSSGAGGIGNTLFSSWAPPLSASLIEVSSGGPGGFNGYVNASPCFGSGGIGVSGTTLSAQTGLPGVNGVVIIRYVRSQIVGG